MQYTPTQAAGHLKESIASYLESQYRMSHPLVFGERAALLRETGVIAQSPFVEATPAFAAGSHIATLESTRPDAVAQGLSEIVEHGLPVGRFPLYTHQEEALLASAGSAPNLLIASGTGSGKTEAFVLPILSRILSEARTWLPPAGQTPIAGSYSASSWLHSRRHERRPAAVRAIVLYPMNALVNDQMSRLRRILALNDSPEWQRENLNGNLIHFGMYTSLTGTTGRPDNPSRQRRWADYLEQVNQEWSNLSPELRKAGNWPNADGPEILSRWDMHAAPPDILVTNYSMLEYMLIRPIEANIFDATRQWLGESPDNKFTLVLDEAHTYTGAKGTEVAHLVRRLKDRLGITTGDDKLRAIATSASTNPSAAGGVENLTRFTGDLFGELPETFTFIQAGVDDHQALPREPRAASMRAFAEFHRNFNINDPFPAMTRLAQDLGLPAPSSELDPTVAAHQLLDDNEDVRWIRSRTARNATPIHDLSQEAWTGDYSADDKDQATAGVLAAGSFARPEPQPDTQPLLSMRVHTFFRGLNGLWACIRPDCPEIPPSFQGERPVGRLYTDPRAWCPCGARVLEIYTCRRCGLIFLGGVPDSGPGALWPWSDQFDNQANRRDQDVKIFGAETPRPHAEQSPLSVTTTPADKSRRTRRETVIPRTHRARFSHRETRQPLSPTVPAVPRLPLPGRRQHQRNRGEPPDPRTAVNIRHHGRYPTHPTPRRQRFKLQSQGPSIRRLQAGRQPARCRHPPRPPRRFLQTTGLSRTQSMPNMQRLRPHREPTIRHRVRPDRHLGRMPVVQRLRMRPFPASDGIPGTTPGGDPHPAGARLQSHRRPSPRCPRQNDARRRRGTTAGRNLIRHHVQPRAKPAGLRSGTARTRHVEHLDARPHRPIRWYD